MASAKRRQRRLLFEQFEDRRVLATAVDDDYYTAIDTPVSGSPVTENDQYNASWPDEYCSTNLEWVPDENNPAGGSNQCLGEWIPTTAYVSSNIVSWPANGTLSPNWDNGVFSFTYTPNAGFSGNDSFEYTISDNGDSDTATVTIHIPNDAPVSNTDSYTTPMNTALTVAQSPGVLANDWDPENNPFTAVLLADAPHGHVELAADGSFVYTPNTNYYGWDSFSYSAADAYAQSGSTTVWISVVAPPGVNDDVYYAAQGMPLTVLYPGVLGNDTDPNGGSLELAGYYGTNPSHGTLQWLGGGGFVYTPSENYTGDDTFQYQAVTQGVYSDWATVTVHVLPIDASLHANNDTYTTRTGEPKHVTVGGVLQNDDQAANHPRSAMVVSYPNYGSLELRENGTFDYTPNAGFVGTDTFTYRFTDGVNASTVGTVSIQVYETPDLALTNFYSDGVTLQVQYFVVGTAGLPFDITLYASPSPDAGILGQPLQAALRVSGADVTQGWHTKSIPATFDDLQNDYYLKAVIDSQNEISEYVEPNNEGLFAGGSFLVHESSGDTVLHYQGTDGGDGLLGMYRFTDTLVPRWRVEGQQTALATPDSVLASSYDVTGDNIITPRDAEAIRNSASGQTNWWQNTANRFDVNGDAAVSPSDALVVINYLAANGETVLHGELQGGDLKWDVSGDIVVSVLDVRQLLDLLNGGDGEVQPEGRTGSVILGNPLAGQTYADAIDNLLNYSTLDLGPITIDSIHIRSHGGSDAISANGAPAWIFGGAGNDVIYGSGQYADYLDGSAGDDSLNGQGGADEIYGGEGDDWLYGDGADSSGPWFTVGADHIDGGLGNDNIFGGGADDQIYGGFGDDTIEGGYGQDTIYGDDGADDDATNPDDGNDTIRGARDADTIYGEGGNDILHSNGNFEQNAVESGDTIYGGPGTDTFYGWSGDDIFYGGAGDDRLDGGGGFDRLEGGDGDDTLIGGYGDDTLLGGDGTDELFGSDGIDEVDGGGEQDLVLEEYDTPRLSITDAAAVEGNALAFTVNLTSPSLHDVIIDITVSGGTAIAGTAAANWDYSYTGPTSLTIPAGQESATITVSTRTDSLSESVESVYASITSPLMPGNIFQGQGKIYDATPSATDIVAASLTGYSTSLTLAYSITAATTNAFTAGLYAVSGSTSTLLQAIELPAGHNAPGYHSIRFAPTFADPGGSYTLTAKLDTGSSVAESNESNNSATLSGVFVSRESGGNRILHVQGGAGADTYTGSLVGGSKLQFTSGSFNFQYFVGNLNGIDFRGQAGNDTFAMVGNVNIPVTAYGDAGDDTLTGGTGNDYFYGGDGNDTITSWDGADTISGGDGNDTISAGDGGDSVSGDAGNDMIGAGNGNDSVWGNAGNDWLYGDSGDDIVTGNDGDDWLSGGDDDDDLDGGDGTSTFLGSDGDDSQTANGTNVGSGTGPGVVNVVSTTSSSGGGGGGSPPPTCNISTPITIPFPEVSGIAEGTYYPRRYQFFTLYSQPFPADVDVHLEITSGTATAGTDIWQPDPADFTVLGTADHPNADHFVDVRIDAPLDDKIEGTEQAWLHTYINEYPICVNTISPITITDSTVKAVDDNLMVQPDQPATTLWYWARHNDEGGGGRLDSYTDPEHGRIEMQSTQSNELEPVYIPDPGYFGPDSFTYTLRYGYDPPVPYFGLGSATTTATVNLKVGPAVTIEDATPVPEEGTGNNPSVARFKVSLYPPLDHVAYVNVSAGPLAAPSTGTPQERARANAISDFADVSEQLTFQPGQTEQWFEVPIVADDIDEYDEKFAAHISSTLYVARATAIGIIQDGDGSSSGNGSNNSGDDDGNPPPELSISDVIVNEPTTGSTNATLTVTLSRKTEKQATVRFNAVEISGPEEEDADWDAATTGQDFSNPNQTVTLPTDSLTFTISVPILADNIQEPDELFAAELASATQATIDDGEAQVTIRSALKLVENAIYGWEGGKLSFYLKAATTQGQIGSFALDVNNDGTYDYSTADIYGNGEALAFDLDLLQLLGNSVDDGSYSAQVRVTTTTGASGVFPVEITVGNVWPDIEFDEDAVIGAAGVAFTLPNSTSDLGPDTVTQIVVDWGDGSSSTIQGGSGTPSHVYAADGHYTIRATTTDEDGSTWAEHEIDIGEDNPPPVDNGDPIIISANATILSNGNAQLIVEAQNSAGGNNDLTYEWDLDGDGEFETPGSNSIEIPPGDGPDLCSAQIRITDGAGRWLEGRYQFTGAGEVITAFTNESGKEFFRLLTPALPSGWQVHHTKQRLNGILEARYLAAGIDVNDPHYLRGVPKHIHEEITGDQSAWWAMKARERGVSVQQAYRDVPLTEIAAFEAQLDARYSKYWVTFGAKRSDINTAIVAAAKDSLELQRTKAQRRIDFGIMSANVAVFILIAKNAKSFNKMRTFNPDTNVAFLKLQAKYEDCLVQTMAFGRPSKEAANQLVDLLVDFGHEMNVDSGAVEKARAAMQAGLVKEYG